jgi:hypothetical protein
LVAFDVAGLVGMLTTIDFNNEVVFMADEVGNERPNRRLAAEAQAVQAMSTNRGPEMPLRVRHLGAQSLGVAA